MPPLSLPYAHLNLRRNPFGELPVEERPARAIVAIERWLAPLRSESRFALQVLGERGNGKTTHLLALRAQLPEATYRHIGEGERVPARAIRRGLPTIIDESQRLSPRACRRVFARGGPLLLGSHRDHADELRREGYEVETIYPAAMLDRPRLIAILDERIESSRRGPGPVPGLDAAVIDALRRRFATNVRAMEHCLYEIFQTLTEIRDVEMFDLDRP